MYTLGADPLRVELKALPEGAELPTTINWSSSNTDCISLTPFTNGCMIFFNDIGTSTITVSHDNPDVESLTVDLTVERGIATFAVTAENRNVVGFTGENLEHLKIPATFIADDGIEYTVTSIENGAFSGCSKLNIITIPETVTTIGSSAFDNCDKLKLIKVDHDYEGISGSPWGASDVAYVEWLKVPIATGMRFEGLDPAKTYNEGDIIRVKVVPVPEGSRFPILGDNDHLSLNWSYYGRPDEVLDPKYNNDIIEWSDSINEKADIERDLILLSPGIAKLEVSCRIDADWNCIEAIQDIEVVAVQHYQVTFDDDCNEVSAWPSPVVGEYDTSGSYRAGREVNITCKDSAIDQFVQWSCDDPSVEFADKTNPTTHFIMPDHDIVIDHTFVTHRVTLSGAGVGATGAGEYVPGKTVTITPGTKEGFEFVEYTCTNTTVQTELNDETPGTFVMPEADTEVVVVWNQIAPINFMVTKENRAMVGYTGATDEELDIPSTFTGDDGVEYKVVGIASAAFNECTNLKSVKVPEEINEIRDWAFGNCSSLTTFDIPNGIASINNNTFRNCTKLTSVSVPESVTTIGTDAFYNCSALTTIYIPESVTTIDTAFSGCTTLATINIDHNTDGISGAPWGADESITTVNWLRTPKDFTVTAGNRAMIGYTGEANEELVIPASFTGEDRQLYKVVCIGNNAFISCTNLSSVTIPEGVTSISDAAFRYCTSLTSVTIPEGITSIGTNAFSGCTKLTSITIPNTVTSIGVAAFNECRTLTSITIPDSVTSIGNSAFMNCNSLTSIVINKGVTIIEPNTFKGCTNLKSVTLTEGIKHINSAFENCTALTSIDIPNSVTIINDFAFYNCPNLTTINVDNVVDAINYAPWNATNATVNWLRS